MDFLEPLLLYGVGVFLWCAHVSPSKQMAAANAIAVVLYTRHAFKVHALGGIILKKRIYMMVGLLCILMLGFGVIVYANEPALGGVSKEVTGSFVSLSGDRKELQLKTESGEQQVVLAKSVWVYKDLSKAGLEDLKAGDRLEIILNTGKQAAYIKAYSQTAMPQEKAADGQAAPSATPALTPAPSASPEPSTAPSLQKDTEDHDRKTVSGEEAWDRLDIKLQGKGLNVHVEQKLSGESNKSKVDIHTKEQGKIMLEGDSARMLIKQIVAGIDLRAGGAEEQLLAKLGKDWGIDTDDVRVDMNIKWKALGESSDAFNQLPEAAEAAMKKRDRDDGGNRDNWDRGNNNNENADDDRERADDDDDRENKHDKHGKSDKLDKSDKKDGKHEE